MNEALANHIPDTSYALINQLRPEVQKLFFDAFSEILNAMFFQQQTWTRERLGEVELTSAEELALSTLFYSCKCECYFGHRHLPDTVPYRVMYVVKH